MNAQRGYLMLEVGVCGALVATILLGLMTQLADARVNTILKNRDLVAQQIANETLSAVRNRQFAAIAPSPPSSRVLGGASYDVVVTVQAGSLSANVPSLATVPVGAGASAPSAALTVPFKNVRVDVSFSPGGAAVRRAVASSRVYGP